MAAFAGDRCAADGLLISADIRSFEESQDPEFCEAVVERIDAYNEMCGQQIEILDCG